MLSFLGLGGIASAIFGFFGKVLDFMGPIVPFILDALRWLASKVWAGLAIIATNLITLFVIVPLMIGAGYYGHKKCETKVITKLHTQYKFVPKKTKSKGIVGTTKDVFEGYNPWKR